MTGQLMRATAMACVLGVPLGTAAAHAEMQLSFYLGAQSSPHSTVKYAEPGDSFSFRAGWEGRSAETPPYYGVRATWWRSENVGFGVELNHAKVYLEDDLRYRPFLRQVPACASRYRSNLPSVVSPDASSATGRLRRTDVTLAQVPATPLPSATLNR